jgi:hypothetical protein
LGSYLIGSAQVTGRGLWKWFLRSDTEIISFRGSFPQATRRIHKGSEGTLAKVKWRALKMKRFYGICAKVRVVGAELASTITFLLFLYAAVKYEISHLLK